MSQDLAGKIAVVTGSSRGIGRGTAIALGEVGATVYITGRSSGEGALTIEETASLVDAEGGRGIPVKVDHGDDQQIAALFSSSRLRAARFHLDCSHRCSSDARSPRSQAWAKRWNEPDR